MDRSAAHISCRDCPFLECVDCFGADPPVDDGDAPEMHSPSHVIIANRAKRAALKRPRSVLQVEPSELISPLPMRGAGPAPAAFVPSTPQIMRRTIASPRSLATSTDTVNGRPGNSSLALSPPFQKPNKKKKHTEK